MFVSIGELFSCPDLVREIRDRIKEYDIVHLHAARSFQNIIVYRYAKKYNVPYIIDAHGSTPREYMGKRELKSFLKWLYDVFLGYNILKYASRAIAETEVGIKEYEELGVSPNKIVIIAPPFDVKDFLELPSKGAFKRKYSLEDKKIIVFLGRIHWIKGIDFLIESFNELAKERNDVVLVIIGPDDGYKSQLEKLINKLNLSKKVLFTGFLGGIDKLSALVDSEMLVQPSRYEQGTRVPFEAVMCNTPIIVSKNTGCGENVRRIDGGYLVEFGNKEDLKKRMQKILDDPTEALNKVGKAKEYLVNSSIEIILQKYEKTYKDCINEKSFDLI